MNTKDLLEERKQSYGDAWIVAGMWLCLSAVRESNLFKDSFFVHNFVLIMSKLARALHSPHNIDHWRDIAGYATLIVTFLEEEENSL